MSHNNTRIYRTWIAPSRETPGSFVGIAFCYQKKNRRDSRRHTPFPATRCPARPSPARPAVTGSARILSPPVSPQRKRRAAAPRDGAGGAGRLRAGRTNTTALRTGGSGPVQPPRQRRARGTARRQNLVLTPRRRHCRGLDTFLVTL